MGVLWLWLLLPGVVAYSPYTMLDGWTYYFEAARAQQWPACAYRFLSFPGSCDAVNLWSGAGVNQRFTLHSTGAADTFHIKTGCGKYLSYVADCSSTLVDQWAQAGVNQAFKVHKGNAFEVTFEAMGRSGCPNRFLTFPSTCASGVDKIMLGAKGGSFRPHALTPKSPLPAHQFATSGGCADPFAWRARNDSFLMLCTTLPLWSSPNLSSKSVFKSEGGAISGTPPAWASSGARWAPENLPLLPSEGGGDLMFFSDSQSADGKHRVGWVWAKAGPGAGAWKTFSSNYLPLTKFQGGEIDQHPFRDTDGKTYLLWKTDDNSVGSKVCRLWAQEMVFANGTLTMLASPALVLDSTHLWWADSFVAGGALIEGPEVIHHNGYYYLFFAAGKYCQDSYSEGVARSKSLFGPYEKLTVPVLSTGMMGTAGTTGERVVGPGHASFSQDAAGDWFIIWHASPGENCNRHAFVDRLKWASDGWPYVDIA